ncbi:hypothetical protein SAMN05216298_0440 [Glycomyces sambucus]|uniref:Excreted virulence factor EspC, type VII ESX diderm n=1 Tax=Glycomyces sambucus TaxID=380244 RepID=A0A1G9CNU6_9ACTN|nr:hypothetical protein [Glycomyces sambucus]SDK53328.1 hypothetical protein SAMN05216298_0440 [Glycomyces sambucus]
MVNVTPDALEEAGSVHLKSLADEYDELLEGVALATEHRDQAFFSAGKPAAENRSTPAHPSATTSAQQSGALMFAFDEAYDMFYTVAFHTAVNIRAMGDALVAIAADHRVTNGEVEASFQQHEAEVRGGAHPDYTEGERAPLDPEHKDEASEYYENQLSGPR